MNKGLEALERVKKFSVLLDSEKDIVKDLVEIIPNTLKLIEKELKALEILKKHIRIAKPFDLETKEEEPFEILDIDLWNEGKQKEDFEFVREVLDL